MLSLENKLITKLEQKKNIFFFCIITVLGVLIRIPGKDFVSKDMYVFLIPWYNAIKSQGGMRALSTQIGDYNILYQTIISLFSYLDINCIYLYKLLSCTFDIILAFCSALFLCTLTAMPKWGLKFNFIYFCVLFSPMVIFNSSYWGQCDSIYVTFLILTLCALYKEKYVSTFVFLGIAFAFKLQAVFILPFLVCIYFYRKKFSILYFFISVLVLELSGIPAFLFGRSPAAPFSIYLFQTQEQPVLYANIANFWCLIGDSYEYLSSFALILTLILLGMGLYLVLSGKKMLFNPEDYLNFCCWIVWTCVMFLPVMHERYTYLLDILLIILCFINYIYLPFAVVSGILSLLSYSCFLFDTPYSNRPAALAFLISYIAFSFIMLKRKSQNQYHDSGQTQNNSGQQPRCSIF